LKAESYLYVLCDVSMPDMSGLDVLRASAGLAQRPPFIMVTGHGEISAAVEALHQGAYGYLTKPLDEKALSSALVEADKKRLHEAEANQKIEILRRNDPLTGLLNKEEFEQQVQKRLSSHRKHDHPCALLLLNIDGLAYINNSFGHAAGDSALQGVAQAIGRLIRPQDVAARVGGDIFAIYLQGIEAEDAAQKVEKIRSVLALEVLSIGEQQRHISVTVTIGAAVNDGAVNVASMIFDQADLALTQARRLGANRIHIYSAADEAYKKELGAEFNSIEAIKNALANDSFKIHFQPIVDLQTGKVSHYEALLRLFDADGRAIPPDAFIKTAEKFGLINRIDYWVIRHCIGWLGEQRRAGKRVRLAINMSGASLNDTGLLDEVEVLIKSSGIDPGTINFEITETAVFHNLAQVQRFIGRAQQLGCRFSLDDFGVGFSSFYYIKQLNVEYLKIDGSFIRNMVTNVNDQVFVRAMVEISAVFGMKVVAEWVEDADTAALLRKYGVGYGQGWYFGKPAPEIP
ncbi:MAG: EAL domain-containing protein, partial [Gammaproteobacteria bacterium]|nr:EAL domain-containing protein [Gammaproteobacteria bacterium]